MLDKIYEAAKKASKENIDNYNKEQEANKLKKDLPVNNWNILKEKPQKEYVYSEKMLKFIEENNFEILEYAKRLDEENFYLKSYTEIVEYYVLKYNKYTFTITIKSTEDTFGHTFEISKIINIETNESIEYSINLETKISNLKEFLCLLKYDTIEDFLNEKYCVYKKLPELLIQKGYEIKDCLKYTVNSVKGHIEIVDESPIYIIFYETWDKNTNIVISNSLNWNVNVNNNPEYIGYYVDYESIEDIDLIIDNINAIKKHIAGEYGYYENNKYYKNKDIEEILNVNMKDEDGKILDCFNHYLIRIEKTKYYNNKKLNKPTINVYNGLEMAMHYKITFNDAAQWSIGDIINISDIVIKYDKKIDSENCILMIRNYQYSIDKDFDDIYKYKSNNISDEAIDSFNAQLNEQFLVDEVEMKGSFTEVMNELKTYLNNMCKIFNINIQF